jgi:hypothetical protein
VHHGCEEARAWIIRNLLEKDGLFMLSEEETSAICKLTEGFHPSFLILLLSYQLDVIILNLAALNNACYFQATQDLT